ncbi:Uu.00g090710.m01.CDS01 [Anthostomella pinea]|uniref:endo-1,3(4)-beta-glucanase n=1 Tax=Anthostomella pinea TaxID=933095 RepID=A0AAI8VP48_9PEZI|nr:Uu.00g090710.m01.CDS01 [Anthostomella pinea]
MGWENSQQHQGKAGPAAFQVRDANGSVEMVTGSPPTYAADHPLPPRANMGPPHQPWWKPKGWRKRTWAIIAVVLVAIILAAVLAGVLVTKANRYPDYSALSYSLQDEYSGSTFFDNFDYFTGYDPAEGFVHYVPKEQAESLNLTYATDDVAVLAVDTSVGPTSSPDASTGRFSVRIESKVQYDSGLFIFDVKHTPYGCGTWPALWLSDQNNWPTNGEIDIMEAVNNATDGNQMTLHTTDSCSMGGIKRKMSGSSISNNCYNATDDNAGCGVSGKTDSYGVTYNEDQGGIMAVEWRDAGIRMWEFGRSQIPSDITNQSPDPSTWGTATADFPNTDCDISSHFTNQSIIVNIDLCGQWAGNVYAESGCPSNCTDYVANNPDAFTNAFWEFGAFQVYKAS